jgi:hypothetical protein
LFNCKKGQKKQLHLIRYDANASSGDEDEWAGKIKHLQKIIEAENKKVEVSVKERLVVAKREMVNQMTGAIENRIIKTESNLTKKMGRISDDLKDTLYEIMKKVDQK